MSRTACIRRALAEDEDGSILPLILGYTLLAIAVLFVCVCATDLYIAQKRLDALADAAALAGADGFSLTAEGDGVRAELTDDLIREQAAAIVAATAPDAALVSASSPDGVSARVTVAAAWHPPLFSPFVPDGVPLEATATSRTALQ
ncbi:pilus assembly protein TadG-related protein [Microbacterium sp. KUDC0406]|uniref:pilus assembly protein TadG-related protein n=1 Tax=Microbacterium sp. KUDC0406 TaxID=2909588 RepID=UPI001F2BE8A2|nr:pilus assembly protein TadG-related protein [Microbacterium sp. KUDC0406]UJP10640.1 pilus assembly protein TadG-related protein [Microbacterium sp. KUDC0406]